ncbi:helix-turn-helix transcriptional regulator [Klebsiella variicola subsp. variicola]|uniref:helix-turn-helix domain-containing protein n=1 Tax=Klebsiella variicola TaxID=244366 RepID=UPI0035A0063A
MDLKNYLKTSGVRQQDFAQLVGESQGYVSRVASGKCLLGAATALKWAAATGYMDAHLQWLFYRILSC